MMNESSNRKGLVVAVALLAVATTAVAQPIAELQSAGERPWAQGISPEAQETARRIFLEGNDLLNQAIFLQAIDKYRQALKHWDHPTVHYNMALALMHVDPLEGHRHMKEAFRYGPPPLDDQKIEYARTYMTLIEKQSAQVEIGCDVPGASVTMDGKPLFQAPGRFEGLVHPGAHSVVAVKEGFVPTEKSWNLLPGAKETIGLKLYTEAQLTRSRTRWPTWVPWTVLGAGMAVALGGGAMHLHARNDYIAFDNRIKECVRSGCFPDPYVAGLRSRGDILQRVAYGGYALGGAALLTGAVLAYLNLPQTRRMTPEELEAEAAPDDANPDARPQASVMPWLGPGSGGTVLTFCF